MFLLIIQIPIMLVTSVLYLVSAVLTGAVQVYAYYFDLWLVTMQVPNLFIKMAWWGEMVALPCNWWSDEHINGQLLVSLKANKILLFFVFLAVLHTSLVTGYLLVLVLKFLYKQLNRLISKVWQRYHLFRIRIGAVFYIPEAVKPGSRFEKVQVEPGFVAEVHCFRVDVGWYRAGTGFRLDDYFYTAAHCLEGVDDVQIRKNGKSFNVSPQDFVLKDMDIAILQHKVAFGMIGLTTAKAAQVSENSIVQATNGQTYSIGLLKTSPALGYVEYEGSTIPGYSGSPYYMGKQVWGMHVGAGATNLGISVEMCKAAMRSAFQPHYKKEETAEWLSQLFKRKNFKPKYGISPFNPDEVFVQLAHGQVVMDRDEFFDIYGNVEDDWEVPDNYEPESFEPYMDSKNLLVEQSQIPPAPVSKRGIISKSKEKQVDPVGEKNMPGPSKTNSTQAASQIENWGFTPQESTRVPQSKVSPNMLENFVMPRNVRQRVRAVLYSFQQLQNMGVLNQEQGQKCREAWISSFLDLNRQRLSLRKRAPPDVPISKPMDLR